MKWQDMTQAHNGGRRFERGNLGQWQGYPRQLPCISIQVVVPGTFMEYTSRRVLTSTWIEGEKLSQSKADNVAELVNVGVVSYLHQLLDIGALQLVYRCKYVLLRRFSSSDSSCPMKHT